MSIDRWILIGFSFLCIIAIVKLLPREKLRDAWVLFLSLQVITWPAGLFAVEMGWIEYPTQFFLNMNNYNRASFSFKFFLFPIVAIFFSLYYPNKIKKRNALIYYIAFAQIL